MIRTFEDRKPTKVYAKSKENQAIIKALNMYGRVPEQWELLEEIERLKEDMKIKDDYISINYNKDTKEYTLDRKNYYKINKRLNERIDYKSKNEKAKSLTNRTIEIIKQQPSGNDEWILERLNGINYCLGGDEE